LEEQKQEIIVSSRPEAVFTVNSVNDLEAAKKYLQHTKKE
jgi:GTP:adenosylcobinamide-phosphate guanylyltransferase